MSIGSSGLSSWSQAGIVRPPLAQRMVGCDLSLPVVGAALVATPGTSPAFDAQGHDVIEALAYRSLVEGSDGWPPRPDVLRYLINDGALVLSPRGSAAARP